MVMSLKLILSYILDYQEREKNLRHNKCAANWVQCNKKAGSSEGKDWMKTKNDIMKIKKHLL